jgi:hypothetical protein
VSVVGFESDCPALASGFELDASGFGTGFVAVAGALPALAVPLYGSGSVDVEA